MIKLRQTESTEHNGQSYQSWRYHWQLLPWFTKCVVQFSSSWAWRERSWKLARAYTECLRASRCGVQNIPSAHLPRMRSYQQILLLSMSEYVAFTCSPYCQEYRSLLTDAFLVHSTSFFPSTCRFCLFVCYSREAPTFSIERNKEALDLTWQSYSSN